jgi:hypothetical protein
MDKSFVQGLSPNRLLDDSEARGRVVGVAMKPEEVFFFIKSLKKKVVSLFGYSSGYEDKDAMLALVKKLLASYSPETYLVNIGATVGGIGAAYPIAKSMGFRTTGIVSSLAVQYAEQISDAVDHICFVADEAWGGKRTGSEELTPTSKAMVACTDIFLGIGGGEITRDEMLAGKALGKPVQFFPAEVSHEWAIQRAEKNNQPKPAHFWGAAHGELSKLK